MALPVVTAARAASARRDWRAVYDGLVVVRAELGPDDLALFGEASWWLGALLGLVHALFAGTALVNLLLPLIHPRMATPFSAANVSPLLEPPGFLLLNYGYSTPIVMVVVHLLYGAIVGEFVSLAAS